MAQIRDLKTWVATGVNGAKRCQIHGHVQSHAMVGAVARDFDAKGCNFGQTRKVHPRGVDQGVARVLPPLQQGWPGGVALRVLGVGIDPWCARHPVGTQPPSIEALDDRLFQAMDVFFDKVAPPCQIEQRVSQDLPRPVVGDLTATVGLYQGKPKVLVQILTVPRKPQGVDRRVLTNPKLIWGVWASRQGEVLHGLERGAVVDRPQVFDLQRRRRAQHVGAGLCSWGGVALQSTTFTMGWVDKVW